MPSTMGIVMDRLLAGVVLLLLCSCTAVDLSAFDDLHTRVLRACNIGEFSGIVVVLVRGRAAYSHACGVENQDTAAPITRQTRFRIFSVTKLLTSLAALRLADSGKIDLDESIARYLPDAPAGWSSVTLRHLLQHTSGLPDLTEQLLAQWRGDHSAAMGAVLTQSASIVPATPPGIAWAYNNFGYELTAEIIERAGQRSFDQALESLVFRPAGMRDANVEQGRMTAVGPASVRDQRLALGYNGSAKKLQAAAPLSFIQRGAGAVHATIDDFVALDQALRTDRLIGAHWRTEMTRVLRSPGDDPMHAGDQGYGLGVIVKQSNGFLHLGHSGGNNGYVCDFEQYPVQDAALIVMSNFGFADISWIPASVSAALATATGKDSPGLERK
jgi:D-alanyl-D-alanine carboxypeptidase